MPWTLCLATDQSLVLEEGRSTLGRSAECELVLPADRSVSRRHARVTLAKGKLTIEDLGSRNGTFVNGERVDGPTRLSPGDRIHCGDLELWVACTPETGRLAASNRCGSFAVAWAPRLIRFLILAAAVSVPAALLLPQLRARPPGVTGSPVQGEASQSTGSLPPVPEAASSPPPNGAQLFARHCGACHGSTGKGGTGPRLAGTSHPHDLEEITATIAEGAPPEMPAFEERLSGEQLQAVAEYVHTLMGTGAGGHHHP